MSAAVDRVQELIGYQFRDVELLHRALTHASFGDGNKKIQNYERLEFLGDRVLGLIAAETLFEKFTKAKEGRLAPMFNSLVDKAACERVARFFELGPALKMSPSEESIGGRDKSSILADATESVMAAVYLDGGLDAAKAVFRRGWGEVVEHLGEKPHNPKSELQELAAKRGYGVPRYDLLEQAGPEHRPVFIMRVELGRFDPCEGQGGSKQEAQREAAIAMLQRIKADG
ncbi:ribonuclease III [Hyphobacterium sp. HN65]|uniref:Ribonuclease 3 n=1 Tax=Hyphobacterium lacteum TaxID=3116575 RepID=A0ABU7LN78_9PROT|nr:ribonuclease III [Hyphobacterium sp. HN65]MEE2525054.1 ribonuclease III [Hyphobacterium sp. HN65]